MPPAISRKGDHFQSYRSGYHEVAPSLDDLFEKAHFFSGDEAYNLECHKSIECNQRMSQYMRNESEFLLITLRRFVDGLFVKAHFVFGDETCNLECHKSSECDQRMSQYMGNELEFLLISLRRFVDASRDKPERRALSVLSLRLPRSRAFAGWSM